MTNSTKAAALIAACMLTAVATNTANAQTVTLERLQPPISSNQGLAAVSACAIPNAGASIDGTPYFENPSVAQEFGLSGTAAVAITLSSSGRLVSESMLQSSGNQLLDSAALRAPRLTKFVPEISHCTSVGGTYLYEIQF